MSLERATESELEERRDAAIPRQWALDDDAAIAAAEELDEIHAELDRRAANEAHAGAPVDDVCSTCGDSGGGLVCCQNPYPDERGDAVCCNQPVREQCPECGR
jgi:hypothetical protein